MDRVEDVLQHKRVAFVREACRVDFDVRVGKLDPLLLA
jgi:hypothetical protein